MEGLGGGKASRDQGIELFRIVAAFGIVSYHTKVPLAYLPYAGLVFFLILSLYLECGLNWTRQRSTGAVARMFLIPWIFWLGLYGALNAATGNPVLPLGPGIGSLLAGTSLHLWFLPMMFAVLVLVNLLKRHVPAVAVFWGALLASCALLWSFPLWSALIWQATPPWQQWLHAAPAVLAGMTLGLAFREEFRPVRGLALILVATGLAVTAMADQIGVAVTYPLGVVGTVLVIRAGRFAVPPGLSFQSLADCTFGVYVTHIVWVRVFNQIIGRERYETALCAFVLSMVTVWLARRYVPVSRHILG